MHDTAPGPLDLAAEIEGRERVEARIRSVCSEGEAEVVLRVVLDGMPPEMTAQTLGKQAGTVYTQLSYARAKLRSAFATPNRTDTDDARRLSRSKQRLEQRK
jgi:DNA-directed RNA polymerase specialized sigma24 family protein